MTSKALLVGIDDYPYPPNRLNSCINDTMAFRQLLLGDPYGFADEDITLLHNQAATYDNVTAALTELVAGAAEGDRLVYFESSHGYQRPVDGVMTECLCLYDKFLDDTDLIDRTKDVPAGVLTVVLDACHSGGMDKMFFPEGQPAVARAKVYTPNPEEAADRAGLLQSVTAYKFFGLAAARTTSAIAVGLTDQRLKDFTFPVQKAVADSTLNATLFSACKAEQTAAAGTLATNNLSAFTYALTTQNDPQVSLDDLCSMVVARLVELNMSQTPQYFPPAGDQPLAQQTFITEQAPTHGPSQKGFVTGPRGVGATTKEMVATQDRINAAIAHSIDDLRRQMAVPNGV